jgi:hypothetical protein
LNEHTKRLEKTVEEHEQRNQARASAATEARRRAEGVERRLDAQQKQNEEDAHRVYAWLKERSSGGEEPGEECPPSEHPVISANYSDPAFAPWQLWLDSCVKLAIARERAQERARQRALLTELIVLLTEEWRSEIDRLERELCRESGAVRGKEDQDGATATDVPAFLTRNTTRTAASNSAG